MSILSSLITLPLIIIHLITANPGEDASRQVNITWHASQSGTKLYVEQVLANGETHDAQSIEITPAEELWSYEKGDSIFQQPRYICRVKLDSLQPGTKYYYYINGINQRMSFTTASGPQTKKWNFLAFADFQHPFNETTHKSIAAGLNLTENDAFHTMQVNETTSNTPLLLCSGDITGTAANESEWRWALDNPVMSDLIFAGAPGDHEYWGIKPEGEKHIPQMPSNLTYNAILTNPQNGCPEYRNSNYYFYYNNVLFVSLNCGDSNTYLCPQFIREADWFRKTILPLKGTYDYLVVFGHKSIYGSYQEDSGVRKYFTPLWYPVFDQAGVDLVVSGHDHMYSRTFALKHDRRLEETSAYNAEVELATTSEKTTITEASATTGASAAKGDGTWYLDLGSSGNKYRSPDEGLYKDGLHAKVYDLKANPKTLGAKVFVSEKEMKVIVFDENGETFDSFTIHRK